MSFHLPSDGWLLTGIQVPLPQHAELLSDKSEGRKEQLREFQCPPPPHLSRKHKYYSFSESGTFSKHIISDWEKKAILSRLKKADPVDDEQFQQRLSNVKGRNSDEHISSVRARAADCDYETSRERTEAFLAAEERREEVFFRHRHLLELLQMEKRVLRAQSWYSIIVSHVFLTALIQERKVQEALETFSHLMAPMVKRFVEIKRRRRETAELTRQHLSSIPFPHPQVIQSMYGTFFTGWPSELLEQLAAKAKPMYLKAGSYLMHEGDIGRVMFMITKGEVSIILRKKGLSKRRTKENSNGVFQIKAPCYVGEFALVCKEPRSASIYCETDIGFWAVSPEDYDEVAKYLSPVVASKQREATDERRRQNLQRFFPLKVSFLRKFTYFEKFSDGSLETLIANVEPLVLHDGDFLFQSGDMDSSVYFVQDGIAVMRDATGAESKVTTGSCVGMFECSCGVNERKRSSIVSINYCDVWRMQRDTLIDVGMSEPSALLHCRKAAKKDRALEMIKEDRVPNVIKSDPYLSFCLLPSQIARLYELCTPCVFLNGERLVLMGQPLTSFVVVVNGAVDITVAMNGEQETFRMSSAASQQQGLPREAAHRKGGTVSVRGQTCVFGAYEFAVSFSQYTCTATSFGLTEALIIDKQTVDAVVPPELKSIMSGNGKARDVVAKAYKKGDLSSLSASQQNSFAQLYKALRDKVKEKTKKKKM